MAIIIGCSGSTGSSLLKTIMNRHSQIFAGPEASLFAFPQLFQKWDNYKIKLPKEIKNDDWQMRKGMDLLQPEFGWTKRSLEKAIKTSGTFPEFIHTFFEKALIKHQKKIWVAKTPANAAGIQSFLQYFPNGLAIQTIRNPYDTIASLIARGMNVYRATAYYIYNTAIALSNADHSRYYQLKYEHLVSDPTATLSDLFSFLNIPYEKTIINARHEKRSEPTKMKGWKHEETNAIGKSSIGRFEELPKIQQELIKSTFAGIKVSENYLQKKKMNFSTGKELCAFLDYPYKEGNNQKYKNKLLQQLWVDRLSRVKHGFYHQFLNYPITTNL